MPLAPNTTAEYVSEEPDVKGTGFEQFADVFARFQLPPEDTSVSYQPFHFLKKRCFPVEEVVTNQFFSFRESFRK